MGLTALWLPLALALTITLALALALALALSLTLASAPPQSSAPQTGKETSTTAGDEGSAVQGEARTCE